MASVIRPMPAFLSVQEKEHPRGCSWRSLVRGGRLELPCLTALPPQDSVSTSSTIRAWGEQGASAPPAPIKQDQGVAALREGNSRSAATPWSCLMGAGGAEAPCSPHARMVELVDTLS